MNQKPDRSAETNAANARANLTKAKTDAAWDMAVAEWCKITAAVANSMAKMRGEVK